MTEARPRPKMRTVGGTLEDFERDLISNLYYQRGTTLESASGPDAYHTLAVTVRDRLVDRYARTAAAHYAANPRFVYYLSAEYLLGRQLRQNLLYTGAEQWLRPVAEDLGAPLEELEAYDVEPGLGNGGLGRLAACLLDSMATLDIPAVGYGIRYEFGIFKQAFRDGAQVERPDDWTFYGNPWEFPAPDDRQVVGFYGTTARALDDPTGLRRQWTPGETVRGEPSHMLVPGFGTQTVNMIRLWRARASRESFDLSRFSAGQYKEAVEDIVRAENISKVLYPDDSTEQGRELRLKQQYFLVACSLRDIIRRYRLRNTGWDGFPAKVVIQLNDTHPVMAITELMRLLVDVYRVDWDLAWSITRRTFNYTCHTLLPEALETWPVALLERLLPRHMEIIYSINHFFLQEVAATYPGDVDKLRRLSIIEEGSERRVRMAHLAVVGSTAVNGVAELHTRLLTATTLRDFAELWPYKFHNVTNGVTPRRFIRLANPRLSALITDRLGDEGWLTDLERLERLGDAVDDPEFLTRWREVKRQNKVDLARHVERSTGVVIDPEALCDVMIKRFHEYKRQHLKLLHVITLFNRIRENPDLDVVPRTVLFGGKAAPGYHAMKLLIHLVNAVAEAVDTDPVVSRRLKVVLLPDYNVTKAQFIIPAADLSEQISLAGKEASGTGNMKLALNGAVTIGTLDGANIEIRDRVGAENFFLFGLNTADAADLRRHYRPRAFYEQDPELRAAVDAIASGVFAKGDRALFAPVVDAMLGRDEYLALADYRSYVDCQEAVAEAWRDQERWTRMSVLNSARSGFFSSDRTVRDYCDLIWRVEPVRVSPA
ncbi:glycogen/starch/alpha-glucan phosphorylase [Dactylosporangium fulvum]|uniref:Alpha-1,4 glucan phosphorylase n=1 Tax=Dactylosporangium fulvum TaxID=53359 RepID=A0ABY5WBG0_9ACTN|nr:glycogen/starch/alpha-glucan phosphorylase [Dactylosporangium fulvum]UWP86023.1 glycogen/starch/alpha-glucan phosphorylase [Dactylosporangium fulvum]